MGYYPIVLELEGRPVLVVGGGTVALRKVESLLEAGAAVTVVSPQVCEEISHLAEGSRLRLCVRQYESEDAHGCALVIAATNDRAVNARVSNDAKAAGMPVNVVDDPDLCTFLVPASIRRGSVLVNITTSGQSPALAKRVREVLESCLGPEYGVLSEIMAEVRNRAKAELPDTSSRERVYDRILKSNVLDLLREDREDDARRLAVSFLREETIL